MLKRSAQVNGLTGLCLTKLDVLDGLKELQLCTGYTMDGEVLDIGGKRVRMIDTPHLPHGWDAHLVYEEVTQTLLCGDLFTATGMVPASTDGDIVGPAVAAEDLFASTCLTPTTAPRIRGLSELGAQTLALMHGPAFTGDCAAALNGLADDYARRLTTA